MNRLTLILASTLLVAASTARAGELDSEFGAKVANVSTPNPLLSLGTPSSELDAESPDQACRRRYGHRRFYGYGYGGFGYARGYYGYGYRRGFGYGRGYW